MLIQESKEWKTAFKTRYRLYEYLVMPFSLANALSSFQHFINDTLQGYLDIFATAYIDDILVYSNSLSEHKKHVELVIDRMKDACLRLDIGKSEFHVQKITFLGLLIGKNAIQMDPKKIKAVHDWAVPQSVKDIQSFVGFANFYRRFIRDFSRVARLMMELTRKNASFSWNTECDQAFHQLETVFVTAPVLMKFDPDQQIVIESDASDYVTGGVMSQYNKSGILRPVAYFSKKHSPAECNYEIYDKELMAIIRCFEAWRPELEGSGFPIHDLSDHKNLEYFMTTKTLSCRQARWSKYLSRFNFKIFYQPGKMNGKVDALTRQSSDLLADENERIRQQSRVVLKPENFLEVHTSNIPFDPALDKPISKPALSEIDDNDLQQLASKVIQSRLQLSSDQAETSSDENGSVDLD